MIIRYIVLSALVVFHSLNISAQTLFDNDSILHIKIACDFKDVLNDRSENSKYHEALFIYNNNTYSIKIKTRGLYRKKAENCFLPPLRIDFDKKQMQKTVFNQINKIKLVLPCYNRSNYEQYILKEYLAYKIYNILTDFSFKVRLVKLKIIDLDKQYNLTEFYAFFIEPYKNLCKRTGAHPLEVKNIHPNFTNTGMITLMSIFQYMIGNTDWSVKALHNIKLLAFAQKQKPIAVPYDFDQSGLVNAAYALPAEHLNIESVRERVYNGYYQPMEVLEKTLTVFKEKKGAIYEEVKSVPGLKKIHIDETIKYFDQFYKTIDHPKKIRYELIQKSRKL